MIIEPSSVTNHPVNASALSTLHMHAELGPDSLQELAHSDENAALAKTPKFHAAGPPGVVSGPSECAPPPTTTPTAATRCIDCESARTRRLGTAHSHVCSIGSLWDICEAAVACQLFMHYDLPMTQLCGPDSGQGRMHVARNSLRRQLAPPDFHRWSMMTSGCVGTR